MTLKIAVQMDPIETINPRGDSTFALMLEAQARGHRVEYYVPGTLATASVPTENRRPGTCTVSRRVPVHGMCTRW